MPSLATINIHQNEVTRISRKSNKDDEHRKKKLFSDNTVAWLTADKAQSLMDYYRLHVVRKAP